MKESLFDVTSELTIITGTPAAIAASTEGPVSSNCPCRIIPVTPFATAWSIASAVLSGCASCGPAKYHFAPVSVHASFTPALSASKNSSWLRLMMTAYSSSAPLAAPLAAAPLSPVPSLDVAVPPFAQPAKTSIAMIRHIAAKPIVFFRFIIISSLFFIS